MGASRSAAASDHICILIVNWIDACVWNKV